MNLFEDSRDNRDDLTFDFADILRETNDAWQLEMDTLPNPVWLPKSQCHMQMKSASFYGKRCGEVTVPEWLAVEKGLV